MCGGRGTRLGGEREKPLVRVGGTPMLDRVLAALDASAAEAVHAVASPNAPNTRAHAIERGVPVVDALGGGYVDDLTHALSVVGRPAVTVAADLPLLSSTAVDRAVAAATRGGRVRSVAVCVPVGLKRRLGASVDTTFDRGGVELAPTGLNVVGATDGRGGDDEGVAGTDVADDDRDTHYVTRDAGLAVNVNRPADVGVAEALCD